MVASGIPLPVDFAEGTTTAIHLVESEVIALSDMNGTDFYSIPSCSCIISDIDQFFTACFSWQASLQLCLALP
jgi:hypothetical protein